MTSKLEHLVEEVLELPTESRAFLAERLLESIDGGEDFAVSTAWQKEIRRRCRELEAGTARTYPAAQVLREMRAARG